MIDGGANFPIVVPAPDERDGSSAGSANVLFAVPIFSFRRYLIRPNRFCASAVFFRRSRVEPGVFRLCRRVPQTRHFGRLSTTGNRRQNCRRGGYVHRVVFRLWSLRTLVYVYVSTPFNNAKKKIRKLVRRDGFFFSNKFPNT